LRRRERSQGKLGDQGAAERENLLRQTRVFLGINHVDACAKHGKRLTFGRNRAAVAGGVNPSRHAADNDQTLSREVADQALRHARTVRRGMPRSDHGDAGLDQDVDTTPDIKNERRVIDFFEARRIRRVVHGNQVHAGSGGTRDFLPRQFR
jgi:hypothetical protein